MAIVAKIPLNTIEKWCNKAIKKILTLLIYFLLIKMLQN